MSIKTTLLGFVIYTAMGLYFASFCIGIRNRSGRALFGGGFLFALAAWLYRGISTGHIPLQNLFEIFLAMGAIIYPLALLWGRLPHASGRLDPLMGVIILWPAGLIFQERPRPLPPALQSPLFLPHVMAYLVGYIFMFKAAILAGPLLRRNGKSDDLSAYSSAADRLAQWGYPALTLGLVLGAVWGKLAWGNYWHWDPKEMWALATWLLYTGYFHARKTLPLSAHRAQAVILIAAFVAILLTVSWVNLSRLFPGLHSYAQ